MPAKVYFCPYCKRYLHIIAPNQWVICSRCNKSVDARTLDGQTPEVAFELASPPRGIRSAVTPMGWAVSTRLFEWGYVVDLFAPFVLFGSFLADVHARRSDGMVGIAVTVFSAACIVLFVIRNLYVVLAHIAVKKCRDEGEVFVGIGPLGRRVRFHWSQLTGVVHTWGESPSLIRAPIELTFKTSSYRFGRYLSEERRMYLIGIMRQFSVRASTEHAAVPECEPIRK